MAHRVTGPDIDDEPTIGRLIADATSDLSDLVRSEIELAKSEIRISIKVGGLGAALLAVAAFLGVLALIMLSVALASCWPSCLSSGCSSVSSSSSFFTPSSPACSRSSG